MSIVEVASGICSALVGLVFLLTGGLKALSPTPFYLHLDRLKFAPYFVLRVLIGGGAFVQCTLGTALLLRLFPRWTFPAALIVLALFIVFTAWEWIAKGAEDCGCYGGLLAVTPRTSILLDLLYAGMILAAWRFPAGYGWSAAIEGHLFGIPAIVFLTVIFMTSWVFRNWGQDMLILSPLRVNRRWNPDWLRGYADLKLEDKQLIVLMSPTCSACKQWTKPLNKISGRNDMPQVIAGMEGGRALLDRYVAEHGVEFPILSMAPSTIDRLVRAFPTVVQVERGAIVSRAEAELPKDLLDRLRASQRDFSLAAQMFLGTVKPPASESGAPPAAG